MVVSLIEETIVGVDNCGFACCQHCGSEFRLFTIFNRDMQGLCRAWKRKHEFACKIRTPAQRKKWAAKYLGKDRCESSLVVDLAHPGFVD